MEHTVLLPTECPLVGTVLVLWSVLLTWGETP